MEITTLIIIAILVEAIWENCKILWDDGKFNVNMLGSLIVGILVCVLAKVDGFAIVGIYIDWHIVAYIFTGVIVSRGANFVNDLFGRLRGE